ncbi:polysaccharide biosynthesis protein [Candidatus Parcubacteria bacterium]|nr:polysaccharide biosynthesis protein [Candidatus Parcubacteria bacterium]
MNLTDKTILNILAQSSNAVLLFISSIILVRYLNKTEYGTYMQIMLISNTAIMLMLLGLPQSIYYFYPKVLNRSHFIFRNILISIFIGMIAALLIYVLKNRLSVWLNNPILSDYGWLISCLVFFRSLSNFREPTLLSGGQLISNAISALLCNFVFYTPLIVAIFFFQSLKILLLILLFSSGVEFIINFLFMFNVFLKEKKSKCNNNEISKNHQLTVSLKKQLCYALPIGISSYLGIISRQFDQFIVSVYFAPKDFAVYTRGAMRIPFLSSLPFTINNIMMPNYVASYQRGDLRSFFYYFHRSIEKLAKVNFPAFSFLFAVAPTLITFLYTNEYVDAASILRVYLGLLVIQITSYAIICRASGKTSFIMHATMISFFINIILSLLLVSMFGAIGAAVATLIAIVVSNFYLLILSCKILNTSLKKIFPWVYLFRLFTVSFIASIPVYCLEYLFTSGDVSQFLILLLDALVYFYCIIFLMMRQGLIYEDDIELLKKWLRFDVGYWLRKLAFLR